MMARAKEERTLRQSPACLLDGGAQRDKVCRMPDENPSDEPNAADVYDENGVDLSLIRWMLRLSPAERIAVVQGSIDLVQRARPLTKPNFDGTR
jgi:hypothetical protein